MRGVEARCWESGEILRGAAAAPFADGQYTDVCARFRYAIALDYEPFTRTEAGPRWLDALNAGIAPVLQFLTQCEHQVKARGSASDVPAVSEIARVLFCVYRDALLRSRAVAHCFAPDERKRIDDLLKRIEDTVERIGQPQIPPRITQFRSDARSCSPPAAAPSRLPGAPGSGGRHEAARKAAATLRRRKAEAMARGITVDELRRQNAGKPPPHEETARRIEAPAASDHAASPTRIGLPMLGDIVGQAAVKSQISEIEAVARNAQMRFARGLPAVSIGYHAVFAGAPGTGKTTLARIYAERLRDAGLLRKGHLLEVSRSDLIGGYMGQTAIKTRARCEDARGGVLFIDEAYSLVLRNDDSFGHECVDTLVKYMEDHRDDLVVVAAGYTDEMKTFLDANRGLKSRFSHWIEFVDYSDEELGAIFDGMCARFEMSTGADARSAALRAILRKKGGPDFANAREVRLAFEHAFQRLSARVREGSDRNTLCMFVAADFDEIGSDS